MEKDNAELHNPFLSMVQQPKVFLRIGRFSLALKVCITQFDLYSQICVTVDWRRYSNSGQISNPAEPVASRETFCNMSKYLDYGKNSKNSLQ